MYYYGIWGYLHGCMGLVYRFTEKDYDPIVLNILETLRSKCMCFPTWEERR